LRDQLTIALLPALSAATLLTALFSSLLATLLALARGSLFFVLTAWGLLALLTTFILFPIVCHIIPSLVRFAFTALEFRKPFLVCGGLS